VRSIGVPERNVDLAADALQRTRNAYLWRWPIPESVAALRAMSEAGLPVGVVSNASGQIAEVLSRSGVCQAGDGDCVPVRVVVDSHVVGVAKPDPLIAGGPMIIALVIVAGIFGTHLAMRDTTLEAVIERTPSIALASVWTLLLFAVIIEQGQGSAFIYFAF
jgi:hypothetical protein